jgi:hypothetical protein
MNRKATTEAEFPFTAYDVSVDHGSIAAWDLGSDGTGYAVQLVGPVDGRWTRSFYLLRSSSPGYARFHLDKEKKIVWFACRAGDRPGKIQPVIDALDRLVSTINEGSESEAWDEWGEGRESGAI